MPGAEGTEAGGASPALVEVGPEVPSPGLVFGGALPAYLPTCLFGSVDRVS